MLSGVRSSWLRLSMNSDPHLLEAPELRRVLHHDEQAARVGPMDADDEHARLPVAHPDLAGRAAADRDRR